MTFWKLVGAIVVANLLTGLIAGVLWLLFISALLSGATSNDGGYTDIGVTDMNMTSNAMLDYQVCMDAAATPESAAHCKRPE